MRKKSKDLKEMQGTYEPSKEGLEAVEYDIYERTPSAPANWPPNIRKIWEERCADLKRSGYMVKAFMVPLHRYCFAVMQAMRAEEQLISGGFVIIIHNESGSYEKPSPWLSVLDQANKTIERIGAKFGFTPLDVQKIPVIKKVESGEESLLA